jgi:excisionase family DNA binding protein
MYEYDNDLVLSVEELMSTLKIGKNIAYSLLDKGIIKAFRIGRIWKIPRNSLEDFIISSAKNNCKYPTE